jgi:hypothetical protein
MLTNFGGESPLHSRTLSNKHGEEKSLTRLLPPDAKYGKAWAEVVSERMQERRDSFFQAPGGRQSQEVKQRRKNTKEATLDVVPEADASKSQPARGADGHELLSKAGISLSSSMPQQNSQPSRVNAIQDGNGESDKTEDEARSLSFFDEMSTFPYPHVSILACQPMHGIFNFCVGVRVARVAGSGPKK